MGALAGALCLLFATESAIAQAAKVDLVIAKVDEVAEVRNAAYWISLFCPDMTENGAVVNKTFSSLDKELHAAGVKPRKKRQKILQDALESTQSADAADAYLAKYGMTLHKKHLDKICPLMRQEIKDRTLLGSFMKAD
ncbi:DUF5333 family protein [Ruegeria jejuensis]|uniref:DUF5333 family protein n=1 Tax=Ruegeria jejuensis TaxID=3233338 RepID=UPI00355B9257